MNNISDYKKRKSNTLIYYFPGLLLLFMMLVVPQGYQKIKAVLLFITLAEIFVYVMLRRMLPLHPNIFRLFVLYIFLGLTYGIYGFIRGNLGALPITKEIVLYPAFCMILICGIKDHFSLEYIHQTLVLSACFLSVYIIATYLNANGIWPDWLYYDLSFEKSSQGVVTGHLAMRGRIEMSFSSYPSLMFLQPYLFCCLITGGEGKKSKLLWFSVVITTIVMLISSSKVLLIIAAVFPIITIIGVYSIKSKSNAFQPRIKWAVSVIVLSIVIVFLGLKHYGFELGSFLRDFLIGFQKYELRPSGNWLYNQRIHTFFALLDGWLERPLFGFGSGAVYWKYLRSATHPYSYELSYMQYLYNWGIVGCMLYAMGLYYILRTSIRIYKKNSAYGNYVLSAAIGCIAFLFGNATNPYLLRFDSVYAVFLPIAIVNLWLREKDRVKKGRE